MMLNSTASSAKANTGSIETGPHLLTKVTGNYAPARAVFVDCEAEIRDLPGVPRRQAHSFRLGVAVCCWLKDGQVVDRVVYHFSRAVDFWSWLQGVKGRNVSTWVFSHNLGYDLTLLGFWELLERGPQELKFVVVDDPPTIIITTWGRRAVTYCDSMNYWRLSVQDLGESVGLPKLPMPASSAPVAAWYQYCQRDVEIIELCLTQMISRCRATQLCSWKATAASLSWHAYRKSFLGTPICIPACSKTRRLERESYYGGRVWCPKRGQVNEPVSVLDVNSLYPSIMATCHLPNRLLKYTESIGRQDLRRMLTESTGIAHVLLESPHPPIPVRSRSGVDYTTGACETVLAGEELEAAYAAGAVRAVYRAALFARDDLFSGYVNTLFASKQAAVAAGNAADATLYKLLLNSLSGKFAQKRRRWIDDPKTAAPDSYAFFYVLRGVSTVPVRYRAIAARVQYLDVSGEPRNAFPAIAATITAASRRVLDRLINSAGAACALYADTDSVHTLLPGLKSVAQCGFLFSGQLGGLREVCRGEHATYWGPRNYRVGTRFCCAGIKANALEIADGIYRQDAFAGIEVTLQGGALSHIVVTERVIKHREQSFEALRVAHGT